MLAADIPPFARNLLFSANLLPFSKKDGGVRPIAVGNVFRRLASKIACWSVSPDLSKNFVPTQVGVGVPSGCEAAVHAARRYLSTATPNRVLVKLDISNAFNSVRRDSLLDACLSRCPSIYRYVDLSYGSPSSLICGSSAISSENGVQQGDPLGPLLFSLAIDSAVKACQSEFNVWYLDDATIGGPACSILEDLNNIIPALISLGLSINPSKSEIFNISYDPNYFNTSIYPLFNSLLPNIKAVTSSDLIVLGSPIFSSAIPSFLELKLTKIQESIATLKTVDAHAAFFLIKNFLAFPRLQFFLQSAPCHRHHCALQHFDLLLRNSISANTNVNFDDAGWQQAILPVRHGGLGLQAPSVLALPFYLSSSYRCSPLVLRILSPHSESVLDQELSHGIEVWSSRGFDIPCYPCYTKAWTETMFLQLYNSLLSSCDQHRRACLLAASSEWSGAWLNAYPSGNTGTLLDPKSVQIGISLRLGLDICFPHTCRCGSVVDRKGLHPLSCRKSPGRIPRHSELNSVVKHALEAAGFPCQLEPPGLLREDGKRPDGVSLFPYKNGKAIVWDATCSDTFASSCLSLSAVEAGSAAKRAETKKASKYASLMDRFIFEPVSVETSGVLGPSTLRFLSKIGRSLGRARNDPVN
ncbi:uncharacterized protein LOC115230817 [Octopus sinensis]|uniref:Uncharacterized protein LOC115230817 n=1 Tax=Octopus sinensis TaxID=2607531 RepID=A0A6P7U5P8_9MOLL|nr:uncharacterized protein LOC115230817 [Octopus sinensis]